MLGSSDLSSLEADQAVSTLSAILRDPDPQLVWEAAWDALYLLDARRKALLKPLCAMIENEGAGLRRDLLARTWAVRCVARIGPDDNAVRVLRSVLLSSDRQMRREAKKALAVKRHP